MSSSADLLSARIARQLEDEILRGERELGERLDERELAEHFEVSRTPVREALQRLAASGLVVLQGGRRGARVARLSLAELLDAFRVVGELEALAAEQAAKRITREQLAQLERHQATCEASAEANDPARFYEANLLFHQGILEASHNWMLQEQMRSARLLTPYRRHITFQPGRMTSSLGEHCAILDAIRDRNGAQAAALMRGHVNTLGLGVSDFLHYLTQTGHERILAPSPGDAAV